jgi:hypothetical protein
MKRFNLETQAWEEEADPEPINSLEYLQSIYRDPEQPDATRIRAAVECLPFENPKLSAVGFMREAETFASRLERAIERSNGARMIEARAVEVPPSEEAV